MIEQTAYCYQIQRNGVDFGSDTFDQRYFDRQRKPRINKKLNLGQHLKVIFFHEMEVDLQTIIDRYGVDYRQKGSFIIEDAIIDLSYADVKANIPHPDRWLGFSSGCVDDNGVYHISNAWEIRAPDAATYNAIIAELKRDLQRIIPHQEGEEELPSYLLG